MSLRFGDASDRLNRDIDEHLGGSGKIERGGENDEFMIVDTSRALLELPVFKHTGINRLQLGAMLAANVHAFRQAIGAGAPFDAIISGVVLTALLTGSYAALDHTGQQDIREPIKVRLVDNGAVLAVINGEALAKEFAEQICHLGPDDYELT